MFVRAPREHTVMNFLPMPTKKDRPGSSAKPSRPSKGSAAFDLWLQRGLHQLFDDVAKEPVPDDLLRLIEDDKTAN